MSGLLNMFRGFLGFGFFLLILILPIALLTGATALAPVILPWLSAAVGIQLVITVVVLLPLALFSGTRHLAGRGIAFFSYLLGITVWFLGLLTTYVLWGMLAVLIGLAIFGVGVVPMALLALAIKGMWAPMFQLLLGLIMVFAFRALGYWLIAKAESEAEEKREHIELLNERGEA